MSPAGSGFYGRRPLVTRAAALYGARVEDATGRAVVTPERLGADKIEILRRWGAGLAASGRDEELRAAGRAVLLLVEEIDGLQRDLWHARARVSSELPGVDPERKQPSTPVEQADGSRLIETLTLRLADQLPAFP